MTGKRYTQPLTDKLCKAVFNILKVNWTSVVYKSRICDIGANFFVVVVYRMLRLY